MLFYVDKLCWKRYTSLDKSNRKVLRDQQFWKHCKTYWISYLWAFIYLSLYQLLVWRKIYQQSRYTEESLGSYLSTFKNVIFCFRFHVCTQNHNLTKENVRLDQRIKNHTRNAYNALSYQISHRYDVLFQKQIWKHIYFQIYY